MKASERTELERMALMAEVAREFVHECANFLNTMRLQFAIWDQTPDKPRDWSRIQTDAHKIFGRLQEWHDFRTAGFAAQKTDLTRLLRQLESDFDSQKSTARLELDAPREPEFLTAPPADLRRLFQLLIECVLPEATIDRGNRPVVKAKLEPAPVHLLVQFQFEKIEEKSLREFAAPDARECSLLIASCRALALRLDVKIRVDDHTITLRLPREQL